MFLGDSVSCFFLADIYSPLHYSTSDLTAHPAWRRQGQCSHLSHSETETGGTINSPTGRITDCEGAKFTVINSSPTLGFTRKAENLPPLDGLVANDDG